MILFAFITDIAASTKSPVVCVPFPGSTGPLGLIMLMSEVLPVVLTRDSKDPL